MEFAELDLEEKEIISDILEKLREVAKEDETTIDNIKRFRYDITIIAIALNSKYTDTLIKIERNKKKYHKLNNEFKRLINKIF